jgi:hypothetical protein
MLLNENTRDILLIISIALNVFNAWRILARWGLGRRKFPE